MVRTIAEEDMERGELKNTRSLLQRLLEKKFSPLPEAVLQRIAAAENLERLNEEVLRVSEIESVDDLRL